MMEREAAIEIFTNFLCGLIQKHSLLTAVYLLTYIQIKRALKALFFAVNFSETANSRIE